MKKILQICLILCACFTLSACTLQKTAKCDSSFAEKEVIEIFKQNDKKYKSFLDLDPTLIVSLENPRAISYDKDIDKYFCEGTVKVKSYHNNFRDVDTSQDIEVNNWGKDYYVTGLECDTKYEIIKSKGKNIVYATLCSWGSKTILGEETEESIQKRLEAERIREEIKKQEEKSTQQYNEEKEYFKASFLKGFCLVNTDDLEFCCAKNGYVPTSYINDFKNNFKNEIDFYKSYYKQHQDLLKKEIKMDKLQMFEQAYESYKSQNDSIKSKRDFCRFYDDNKQALIQEKLKTLKEAEKIYFH